MGKGKEELIVGFANKGISMRSEKEFINFCFIVAFLMSSFIWGAQAGDAVKEKAAETSDVFNKRTTVNLGQNENVETQEQSDKKIKIKNLERQAKYNFQRGRIQEAQRNINELIELNPYRPDYHLAYALVLRAQGEKKLKDLNSQMIEEFKAIDEGKSSKTKAQVIKSISDKKGKIREFDECFKKLDDVLELHGSEQMVYLMMAEYYERKGKRSETLVSLRKAAESGMNIMEMVVQVPILKPLQKNTEFINLALKLEKFELRSLKYNSEYFKNHMDPFTPSSKWKIKTKKEGGVDKNSAHPNQFWTHEEETELFLSAKRATSSLMQLLNAPVPDEEKIAAKYEELKKILQQGDRLRIPRLKREFVTIAEKVKEIETKIENVRLRIYYKKVEKKIAEIKEAFANAKYKKVQALYPEVNSIIDKMKSESKSFVPLAETVKKIADSWYKRSMIREEFKGKNLQIRGIVTSARRLPEGRTVNSDFVIINNKLKEEGSEFEDFKIDKIERNRVTFVYKGEHIGMIFRRY